MKVKTRVGSFEIEVDGADLEECFTKLSEAAELFSLGVKCGKTGCPDVIPRIRVAGEYKFPEFFCSESNTSLLLGRKKDGGYYPRQKSKAGEYYPNNGWLTYKERKAIDEGGKQEAEYDPNF